MKLFNLIFAALLSSVVQAQEIFVDAGACPGEGCTYGNYWIANVSAELKSSPDISAEIVSTVQQGETVLTLTGEVHTIPSRFIVSREHEEFVPEDEVLVYTYLGEGWFRILHNGELKDADLNFGPSSGASRNRCGTGPRCWGFLLEELQYQWWIKVRTADGNEGWRLATNKFP